MRTEELRRLTKPKATNRDIAREAGVSEGFFYMVLRGERKPNAALRAAVEKLLNVPASTIFGPEADES